jgi:hypothetical protein
MSTFVFFCTWYIDASPNNIQEKPEEVLKMDLEKSLKRSEQLMREMLTSDRYFGIEFDSAQSAAGLTKIPVITRYNFNSGMAYKLVGQAQEEGMIKVKETGNVPSLEVYNQASYPVLIPSGSLLISKGGGWQDRVLVTDVMIDAGKKLDVPVACVEAHRWTPRSKEEAENILKTFNMKGSRRDSDFGVKYFASPSLTQSFVGSVNRNFMNYERGRRERMRDLAGPSHEETSYLFRADQSSVWNQVGKEIEEADVHTPTQALTEVVAKKEKEGKLKFDIYEGEIGNIFVGRGRVLGMEFYEKPEAWQNISEQTIKRYKMDSRNGDKFSREIVDKFLGDLNKATLKSNKSIGLGYDVRLMESVDGACLVIGTDAQYSPVHFTALPKTVQEKRNPDVFQELFRYPRRTEPTERFPDIPPGISDDIMRTYQEPLESIRDFATITRYLNRRSVEPRRSLLGQTRQRR